MKGVLWFAVLCGFFGLALAQITPPKDGPDGDEKYKPTENWQVFKGAKTYYVYDNPLITDKRHLQCVAFALEKWAALTPAETPDKADVIVRCFQVIEGKTVLYSRPGYGGVVTTTRQTPDYFHYQLLHGEEVVFGWTPTDYLHGGAFGKKVAKKIHDVNK